MSEAERVHEVESISVVGGGDSGLLAALLAKEFTPEVDVTVIDDFGTSPPEVGKSTFIDILELLHDVLGIDEERFFDEVKPVWKTSAYFQDWCDNDPFHLPFDDESIIPSEPGNDRFESFYHRYETKNFNTLCAQLTEQHKSPFTDTDLDEKYDCIAYHLNSGRFNEFLRDVCTERGIALVDDEITDVVASGTEIERIESDRETYQSDLYFDATGFSRLLMENLDAEYRSFDFPLDSALVTKLEISPSEIVPATVIESGEYGWSWQIDTFDYRDLGYVFSSDHASPEEAIEDFRDRFGQLSSDDVRHYTFDSGVYERAWVGNCVAVGNSAGFLEPLTATALTLGANLSTKFSELLADHNRINHRGVREIYNEIFSAGWENVRTYVELLYQYPSKDNEFWNDVRAVYGSELDRLVEQYHENGMSSHRFFDTHLDEEIFPFDHWDVYRLLRNLGVKSEFYEELDVEVSDEQKAEIRQMDSRLDEQVDDYLTYEEVADLLGTESESGETDSESGEPRELGSTITNTEI